MNIPAPLPLLISIAVVTTIVFFIGAWTERSQCKYHLKQNEMDARIRANDVRRRLHEQLTNAFIAMTEEADRRRGQR